MTKRPSGRFSRGDMSNFLVELARKSIEALSRRQDSISSGTRTFDDRGCSLQSLSNLQNVQSVFFLHAQFEVSISDESIRFGC